MIGWWLHYRAGRRRDVFDACLTRAGDRDAFHAGVYGWTGKLPWWARHAEDNVRIAFGSPLQFLFELDAIEGRTNATIRDVWPRWRTFVHTGEPFAPYKHLYRRRAGDDVTFVEAHFSEDGQLLAVQDRPDDESLALLAPAAALEALGHIVETSDGRARIVGHKHHALNMFGESLTADEIDRAVGDVRHFTILPELPGVDERRGRHVWLIEFAVPPSDLRAFETALDDTLAGNRDYAKLRSEKRLRPPVVRLVRDGVFEEWKREHGEIPRVMDAARADPLLPR